MSLYQYLKDSASRFPNRPAVSCKGKVVNYSELKTLSDQIAESLITSGISPGERVGIYLEKSIESVAAIFGILKTGCAYIPLDIASPPARTQYIIDNSGMGAIIKELKGSWTIEKLKSGEASPPNLAYLLYTSGSTGAPKGVMISHQGSAAFVDWATEYFQTTEKDVFSSHAPFHFDLSIFDIFVSVKCGGHLCLLPSGLSAFPIDLATFISENKISVWYSVPYVLTQLALHGELGTLDLSSLRTIIFAGEVFHYPFLNSLRQELPGANFFNLYGPTETNVITHFKIPSLPTVLKENAPIGRACPYAEIEVAEDGELIVSSKSTMLGYWGDLPKTKNSFRGKFYLTGDQVKRNSTGDFVFISRKDNMIKSRGFRIELGEIESILAKHDFVQEVAAFAIPDVEVGNRIFAAVALRPNAQFSEETLKKFCISNLPSYMVPERISVLEALPKTSTGKLDRLALYPAK